MIRSIIGQFLSANKELLSWTFQDDAYEKFKVASLVSSIGPIGSGIGDVTYTAPVSTQIGDVMILMVETANESISTPAGGWAPLTTIGYNASGSIDAVALHMFTKVQTTLNESVTVLDPGTHQIGVVLRVRNGPTFPFEDAALTTNFSAVDTTTVSIGAISNNYYGSNNNFLFVLVNSVDSTTAQASGMTMTNVTITERANGNTNSGNGGGIAVWTGQQTGASIGVPNGLALATAGTWIFRAFVLSPRRYDIICGCWNPALSRYLLIDERRLTSYTDDGLTFTLPLRDTELFTSLDFFITNAHQVVYADSISAYVAIGNTTSNIEIAVSYGGTGQVWEPITIGLIGPDFTTTIYYDPTSSRIMVGSSLGNIQADSGNLVFSNVFTPDGVNWALGIRCVGISKAAGRFCAVSSAGHVATSTDGISWTTVVGGIDTLGDAISSIASNSSVLIATIPSAIFPSYVRSTDGGLTWTSTIAAPISGAAPYVKFVANQFVMFSRLSGQQENCQIATSFNGTDWTVRSEITNSSRWTFIEAGPPDLLSDLGTRSIIDVFGSPNLVFAVGENARLSTCVPGEIVQAPLISLLTDTFTGGTIDNTKWEISVGGTGTVVQSGGVATITANNSGINSASLRTLNTYSLLNTSVFSKITFTGTNFKYFEVYSVLNSARVTVRHSGVNLVTQITNDSNVLIGGDTFTDYSESTYAWLRLRHASGVVYVDSAPSSADNPPSSGQWVNRSAVAGAFFGFAESKLGILASSAFNNLTAVVDCVNTGTS